MSQMSGLSRRVYTYTSSELRRIGTASVVHPTSLLCRQLGTLFDTFPLRAKRRGCRGGRRLQRPIPVVASSAYRPVIRPPADRQSVLIYPKIQRHAIPPKRMIRAGMLNIRSMRNKLENVLELFHEFDLKLLFLAETWHEGEDSVTIKRLRGLGFSVIEAARPLPDDRIADTIHNSHLVNHGGLAVIAKSGIVVSKIDSKLKTRSFEHLCCRVGVGSASLITVVIYRPGSQSVSKQFYVELATLFETLTTYNCGVLITGDLNVHLEDLGDVDSQKLAELISSFDLRQYVQAPTHDHGGLLDVVITSEQCAPPDVTVADVGLSDHKLVHWTLPVTPYSDHYITVQRRKWRNFKLDQFVERLEKSPLCTTPDPGQSGSDLALCFQVTINEILDEMAPMTTMSLRPRQNRPFYDADCKNARRHTRRLERDLRKKKGTNAEAEALLSWRASLKARRSLVRRKGRLHWRQAIESAGSDSKQTWKIFDELLGNKAPPMTKTGFSAVGYHDFIDAKVANIRDRTDGTGPATYTTFSGPSLDVLAPPTLEEVISSVKASPNKQCALDPLPMWLLKDTITTLAPFLTALMSAALADGEFPQPWKHALIRPHLKKAGLDPADPASYRPVRISRFFQSCWRGM